ncbi:toll/interleukin-1 receptor domain-containing protein [Streptomyces sp. NPDC001544]|uniref:toll/interleukin-1 receptor domain-containing protein n=1 Tax=Streptomyces sp. NPDC001544 TaxID=3364584 RepID=UPI0036A1064B
MRDPDTHPAQPQSDRSDQRGHPEAHAFAYDAFISYSTAADGDLAATLQHHVERMGLPAYRRRRLRLFRDFTSLSADADAQRVIEEALARSRRFILLLSPEASRSKWVGREVQWWRENRSTSDMILVLTAGTIRWNDTSQDWDWTDDTPLPQALRGAFTAEPLWVDLSGQKSPEGRLSRAQRDRARTELLNGCATIAAPLRSMDKDVLYGDHIVQLRRARQFLVGGIAVLSVLLVLAGRCRRERRSVWRPTSHGAPVLVCSSGHPGVRPRFRGTGRCPGSRAHAR